MDQYNGVNNEDTRKGVHSRTHVINRRKKEKISDLLFANKLHNRAPQHSGVRLKNVTQKEGRTRRKSGQTSRRFKEASHSAVISLLSIS